MIGDVKKEDVRVVKHTTFTADGESQEMFHIEIKDDVLNDITREQLLYIREAISMSLKEERRLSYAKK